MPAPAYPASVIANWTLYTGRIYPGPVSTGTIVNRSGVAEVEDLVGVGITDLPGYAPAGTTTVAEMEASDNYSAWLHDETAVFPTDPDPIDGPYFNNSPSYIVVKQPLYAVRANGQDLALIDHRGHGTGPSFVLQTPTPFIQFETTAGDAANLRVWDGTTTTSIATLALDSRVRLGTGSVDSWIAAGIWWDGAGGWRIVIEADFDDGNGRQVLVDDNTVTGGTFDGANLTRVRALAPQVFGSYCFGQGPESDMLEALEASIYEVEELPPPNMQVTSLVAEAMGGPSEGLYVHSLIAEVMGSPTTPIEEELEALYSKLRKHIPRERVPSAEPLLRSAAAVLYEVRAAVRRLGWASDRLGATGRWLDLYGASFGLRRLPGESDADYRERLVDFETSVTPENVGDAVETIMGAFFEFYEWFDYPLALLPDSVDSIQYGAYLGVNRFPKFGGFILKLPGGTTSEIGIQVINMVNEYKALGIPWLIITDDYLGDVTP